MREDDDAQQGTSDAPLADGLGETGQPGDYSSTSEPYGDADFDDTYDEDAADDDTGDTAVDDEVTDEADDGGYGDGETDDEVVIYDETAEAAEVDDAGDDGGADTGADADGSSLDDGELLTQDASPLEGIGYLLEEVRDALLGDDESAGQGFEPDPAELASNTDLDLTGDGAVDGADLHEAGSVLDFDVDGAAGGGHDEGVIDA